jgi:K+-transporting ATPase KdpF subunit
MPSFAEVNLPHFDATAETSLSSAVETLDYVWAEWRRRRIPLWLFLGLCLNGLIAPAVYAAADGTLARGNAYTLGLLGLVTIGLSIYLFVVIFQPERF